MGRSKYIKVTLLVLEEKDVFYPTYRILGPDENIFIFDNLDLPRLRRGRLYSSLWLSKKFG